jgi:tetratricopeptide (TPR) repeat protein
MRWLRASAVSIAAAALGAAGGAAAQQHQPGITVLGGGGLAAACSTAVNHDEATPQIEATCTQSLESEQLLLEDRAGTFVNRGVVRLRLQRYDEAVRDFTIALSLRSDLAEAYVNRGAAKIGGHHFAEALDDLNKALAMGVNEPEKAYYNRALAYEWLDNPKAAWLDYNKALELAPDWDLVKQQLTRFTVTHAEVAAQPTSAPKP